MCRLQVLQGYWGAPAQWFLPLTDNGKGLVTAQAKFTHIWFFPTCPCLRWIAISMGLGQVPRGRAQALSFSAPAAAPRQSAIGNEFHGQNHYHVSFLVSSALTIATTLGEGYSHFIGHKSDPKKVKKRASWQTRNS